MARNGRSCRHIRGTHMSSVPATPRTVRSYHRGNGNLRGGGVQKVYDSGPAMKTYKHKLDHRLGYCIFGCLTTIATVLIIFGLFHETAHDQITDYIQGIQQIIINSLPESTTTTETPVTSPSEDYDYNNSTTRGSTSTETVKSRTTEPETCLGSEHVDAEKCLTVSELQNDYNLMHDSHIALWNLMALNVITAMLLLPVVCIFHSEAVQNKNFKLIYRAALFLVLCFMGAQLVFLISPLLVAAIKFPSIVDKLFIQKLPRDEQLVSNVESRFACNFDYILQMVELNLQVPCPQQIKNALFPVFGVVLLIIIDLIPFFFMVFTYAWDACIKDTRICSAARRRVELNHQRRPQSREDILKKAMAEPHYV